MPSFDFRRLQGPHRVRVCGIAWIVGGAVLLGLCRGDSAAQIGRSVGNASGRAAAGRTTANPRFASDEVREQFQRSAGRVLHFREREQKRRLDLAIAAVKSRNAPQGLQQLQRILDGDDDRFTFRDGATAIGQRRLVQETLNELDQLTWATYNQLFDGKARRLAEDDRIEPDRRDREVVRRFLFTRTGFEAGRRLAVRAFDRGEYERAADLWLKLRAVRVHRNRFGLGETLQLAVALQWCGRSRQAETVVRGIGDRKLRIGGRLTAVRDYFNRSGKIRAADAAVDWLLPGGNPGGDRTADVSTLVPEPLWDAGYDGPNSAAAKRFAAEWVRGRLAGGRSTAVVNAPLVVNGQVLVRDFEGVSALDLSTGRRLWSVKTETSLAKAANSMSTRVAGESPAGPESEFGPVYAANDVMNALTSDGGRMYFLDAMDLSDIATPPFEKQVMRNRRFIRRRFIERRSDPDPAWNRLTAVDVRRPGARDAETPTARKPEWVLGGPPDSKASGVRLKGHYFLGPPLPVAERLYAVCEFERRIQLLCLRPENGDVEWRQTLAVTEGEISSDAERSISACTPACAEGVLVCPTRLGFVTGVDALTGSLLWAAFAGDDPEDLSLAPLQARSKVKTTLGFRSPPLIHDGRVFYLPPGSTRLFCFDLHTGRTLWTAPREDGRYVGAADDERVLVVGRRATRGYAAPSGKLLWTTRTPVPSGRGLATQRCFLLPVQDGRVMMLERSSGRPIGLSVAGFSSGGETDWRPGNLVAAGGVILSAEVDHLRAFPQAQTRLAAVRQKLKQNPRSAADLHAAARLSLLVGRLREADRLLTAALDRLDVSRPPAGSPAYRRQQSTRRLLRELLFARLDDAKAPARQVLQRIGRLSVLPDDRARYLMRKAEFDLQRGDIEAVLSAVDELAGLDVRKLFPRPGDDSHLVSLSAWVPGLFARAQKRAGKSLHDKLLRSAARRLQGALTFPGTERLERFLAVFGSFPLAGAARNELSRRLIDAGEHQRAELLLLANRASPDRRTAATATALLFRLRTQRGLYENAAPLRHELATRFADVLIDDAKTTGRELAERARQRRLTDLAARRFRGPQRPVQRVAIAEERWLQTDESVSRVYNAFRQLFHTPRDCAFDLLDLGNGFETEINVVDRFTGVTAGKIVIPTRHSYPVSSGGAHVGQYFSLGSAGRMHGVSLLELQHGGPFWSTPPQGFERRDDMLLVGPAGPRVAVFQARDVLAAVDPGTGRLLWQRNDLPPLSGLRSDPYSGLFGDDEVLVLFESDRRRYTTYETRTGNLLRQGRLNISGEYERRLLGRRVFFVADVGGKTRMRLWDPVRDRFLIDRPFEGRLFTATTDDDDALLALLPDGQLLVCDSATGRLRQTLRFDGREMFGVTYMKAFRAGGRLYVNLQRAVALHDPFFSFYVGDTFVPAEHVSGELYAFDAATGRRLWKRVFPQRTVLRPRHGALPFLVLAGRIRDRVRGTRTSLLIEVIDASTGRTLGRRDDLFPTRILHMSYDPQRDAVELRGTETTIRLHLRHRRIVGPRDETTL